MLSTIHESETSSFINLKAISLWAYNVILAIWLGICLNFSFYETIYRLSPYSPLKNRLLVFSTVCIVVLFFNLVIQLISWSWNAKILSSILVIVGGFSAYFVNSLGVLITADQIQNMLQTDLREVQDLWSLRLVVWSLIMVVLPLILIWQLEVKSVSVARHLVIKAVHIACSLFMIMALLFFFYADYAAMFREHRELKSMISPQNTISASLSYYQHKAPKQKLPLITYGEDAHLIQDSKNNHLPKLMVLVVGETARAQSFTLNGYGRNTNPELKTMGVMNFSQVSSCGTATAHSVPCMFSGMPRLQYDESLASHREGLLDIAQRAGYQVTWIDNNSGCKGTCDRVHQAAMPEALQKKWCDANGECFDEILVDRLNDYLAQLDKNNPQPQLLVLHQMGSHGPAYFKRSKVPYQPFQPSCNTNAIQGCSSQELINSYDNSIVYTDHVLAQLIHRLAQQQNYETGLWYVSDHGESTGEHGLYLHGAPYAIAPSQQTHVPMILWFSDAWKTQHPEQVACLASQQQQSLSHDHLFPSLLSLLDIKTQAIDPKNDMLKRCRSVSDARAAR